MDSVITSSDQINSVFLRKKNVYVFFIFMCEICKRRQYYNKDTYLAFLDLKKAYDSVPIRDILNKINRLGVRGRVFEFIKNFYATSKACVKVNNKYSESFHILRGVRQRYPLFPILFKFLYK